MDFTNKEKAELIDKLENKNNQWCSSCLNNKSVALMMCDCINLDKTMEKSKFPICADCIKNKISPKSATIEYFK